jgi:hypothetical protein
MRPTSATEVVVDALAVHRVTRLVQDDDIPIGALREQLLDRYGDRKWTELLTCPWCLSMWVAAGVVLARHRWPRAWPWIARARRVGRRRAPGTADVVGAAGGYPTSVDLPRGLPGQPQ